MMRSNTTKALVNLASFLKPRRTDLLDQRDDVMDTERARFNKMYLDGEFNSLIGNLDMVDEDLRLILTNPLSIILDQVLAPQGLSQTIFAFNFIANILEPGSRAAIYSSAVEVADLANAATKQSYDFNGLLQSPAGGFIVQNHQAVYEMYPADSRRKVGLRTQKIIDADYETPSKALPTFGYIAILDPRYNYSRTESEIASTMTRAIPTIEFSKCVPYFNLSISSESSTPNQDGIVSSDMSYNKYFESGLAGTGFDINTMSGLQSSIVTDEDGASMSGSMKTTIGMEAFTMPQSIAPMAQPVNSYREGNSYSSIDPTRPFMSVDSFSVSVSPTRGESSTQRAKMTITVHDRGRIRELGDLLKPATLNKVEFTIEYGWSHPQGSEIYGNVYGQLINSMRSKGTFSLSACNYSFTDDGQVKVTLDMVCKGVEAINTLDCALTGQLAALSDVVEKTYDALALARSTTAQELGASWVASLDATQQINTLTLGSVGSLVNGDTANAVDEWIRKTGHRSSPAHLREFSALLSTLRLAASNMNKALIDDLEKKVAVITQKSYNDWSIFTHAKLLNATAEVTTTATPLSIPLYNGVGNDALERGWNRQRGAYAPLAALLQLFIVHPLHNSGQYDEVQLITYTANLNSSIAAGANLGAIPIDMKSINGRSNSTFLKVLTNEYKLNGGQYPINRFIRFINETYIQPHMSSCYGFGGHRGGSTGNSALTYNAETGEMVSDAIDGAGQAKIAKAIRKYYYGTDYEGDPFDPRPTTFTPIALKIVFDVSKGDSNDITSTTGVAAPSEFSEKTVLRIHVFDEASGDRPGVTGVLRENITKGVIVPGKPKAPAGMSEQLRSILLPDGFNFNDTGKVCQQLAENGILKAETWDSTPADTADTTSPVQVLQRRLAAIDNLLSVPAIYDINTGPGLVGVTPVSFDERRRLEAEKQEIDTSLNAAIASENAPAKAYSLAATPQLLIDYCAQAAPTIVYGEEGSSVQQISIKSRTNSRQASMFMRRALDGGGSDTDVTRGVPMRMMPADMGIDMLGNPNIKYMQKFFVKLGTGTSFDNLYGVSGLTHNMTPDSFKTTLKLVNHDAYGVFNSLVSNIDDVKGAIDALENQLSAQAAQRVVDAAGTARTNAALRLSAAQDTARDGQSDAQADLDYKNALYTEQFANAQAVIWMLNLDLSGLNDRALRLPGRNPQHRGSIRDGTRVVTRSRSLSRQDELANFDRIQRSYENGQGILFHMGERAEGGRDGSQGGMNVTENRWLYWFTEEEKATYFSWKRFLRSYYVFGSPKVKDGSGHIILPPNPDDPKYINFISPPPGLRYPLRDVKRAMDLAQAKVDLQDAAIVEAGYTVTYTPEEEAAIAAEAAQNASS